jgi:hypothetical protein
VKTILGVPETAFSRSMEITWLDEVGPRKAQTIDPDAGFLGPRYDKAILRYYSSLWRTHTREMLGAYYVKFLASGSSLLEAMRGSPGPAGGVIRMLLTPLSWCANGIGMLALYSAIALWTVRRVAADGSPQAFTLGLLSAAACLVQIESGVIFSLFNEHYHNYAAFYALFVSLLGWQLLTNAAASAAAGRAGSVTAAAAAGRG